MQDRAMMSGPNCDFRGGGLLEATQCKLSTCGIYSLLGGMALNKFFIGPQTYVQCHAGQLLCREQLMLELQALLDRHRGNFYMVLRRGGIGFLVCYDTGF